MNCSSCNSPFDLEKRTPKLLPHCGHSLCTDCILTFKNHKESFECPQDKLSYSSNVTFNDNLFLIEQLQKQLKSKERQCHLHRKENDLYCQDCKTVICSNCVLFGNHKNHSYESVLNLNSQIKHDLHQRYEKLKVAQVFIKNNM